MENITVRIDAAKVAELCSTLQESNECEAVEMAIDCMLLRIAHIRIEMERAMVLQAMRERSESSVH